MPAPSPRPRYLGLICALMRWICLAVALVTIVGFIGSTSMVAALSSDGWADRLKTGERSVSYRPSDPASRRDQMVWGWSIEYRDPGKKAAGAKAAPPPPANLPPPPEIPKLSAWDIAVLAVALGLPLAALVWALWRGAGMFQRLGRGEYFARPTVQRLRDFAVGLWLYKALPLALMPLAATVSEAARWQSPQAESFKLSMTFNPLAMDGLMTLLFLAMVAISPTS